uniref:IQ motif containing K n=1 Tax=Panthera leo TaxID=9689 RepID=A0A8C8XU15_PANLE
MAAPGRVSSRTGPREEPAGSTELSDATRTPVPTVSPVSPELPVSPGQGAEPLGKNLWEQICEEYEAELPPFPEGCKVKPEGMITVMLFHGWYLFFWFRSKRFSQIHLGHLGFSVGFFLFGLGSPKEYLETFIFPVLLPGMASLLHQAKKEKCFERKRTKFIACDFLTEWLYNQNPKRIGESFTEFFSIPFVEQWLKHHPRPAMPLSLLLTEGEAALIIQSFWRAYLVRCDPEIQELRQWQKKLREDNHIHQRVKIFWAKQEQKG